MKLSSLAVLLAFAALGGCSKAPVPLVQVSGAWCRAAPAGAAAGGCYLTLTASADDRLVAIETPAADHGEIHTMDMTDGVMRMRQLKDGIVLPAGEAVALKPGARHLMIIGPKETLAVGGVVPMTLKFSKAPDIRLNAPILTPPAPPAPGMAGMVHP
jgi:copper(I)-binding protein